MVNQVEYHPRLAQEELHAFCKEHNIQLEAWSPLMQGQLLDNPTLQDIAKKYNKSTAQIILRWDLQNEVVTIPKSIKEHRIIENANIFDFELSADDMKAIQALNEDRRVGPIQITLISKRKPLYIMQWFFLIKTENLNYIQFN